jgi:hypothetical protein
VNVGAARPVPAKAIVWGLLGALSVMVTVPYLLPTAVGVNVTLMMQLAPTLRLAPQVLLAAKSPVAARFVITTVVVPALVRVAFWDALLTPTGSPVKVRVAGETVAVAGDAGVPVSRTTCGLPAAPSVMVKAPTLELGIRANGV